MKIKVTVKDNKNKLYQAYDDIPDGLFIDAGGDVVLSTPDTFIIFNGRTGVVEGNCPSYPLTLAPAGTKIEITA